MSGINFEEEEEENGSWANLRSQFLGLGATLLLFNLIFNRDKMLNPTIFFFQCSLNLRNAVSKSLVLPETSVVIGSRKD